jgi:glutathione synthase/RimK-type ligase-like ATP-grasp enzyme
MPVPEYLGLAKLMRLNLSGVDLRTFGAALIEQAAADERLAHPLLDAAIIFQILGNPEMALTLQQAALQTQRLYCVPSAKPTRLRLLALMAPGDLMANVPIECLLEDSDIELNMLYVTGDDDLSLVPEHDVLFIAMSETESNRPILAAWMPLLEVWPRPVVNNPHHIGRVARDTASELLRALPGVQMPLTARMTERQLREIAQNTPSAEGFPDSIGFPLIIRPVDSHAGQHLYRVEDAQALQEKLDLMACPEYFVSNYIDYRSEDGQFRKYRIVLIDGQPFACHMAISDHWIIHYLNAGMAENPAKREEESAFMANFSHEFAVKHSAALEGIGRAIGLDYLGIDCAETRDGELLVFEVDHAMVVHAMDPVDIFPYKQPQMQKVFTAFRDMLMRAAQQGSTDA